MNALFFKNKYFIYFSVINTIQVSSPKGTMWSSAHPIFNEMLKKIILTLKYKIDFYENHLLGSE